MRIGPKPSPCLTTSRKAIFYLLTLFSFSFPLSPLEQPRALEPLPAGGKPQTVFHRGYMVPHFSSAAEQLRYAQAWFPDIREKRAALEVLLHHFRTPAETIAKGELELAFLELGQDYRSTDRTACTRAVAAYQRIITNYFDHPTVCAKANWHLGWIHADLMGNSEAALVYYRTVARRYAETFISIEPPVPWVSLVLPQIDDKPQTVYERPTYSWSSMALLEIVRHAKDPTERHQAIEQLLSQKRDRLIALFALKIELKRPDGLTGKILEKARSVLSAGGAISLLEHDINQLLVKLTPPQGCLYEKQVEKAQ